MSMLHNHGPVATLGYYIYSTFLFVAHGKPNVNVGNVTLATVVRLSYAALLRAIHDIRTTMRSTVYESPKLET